MFWSGGTSEKPNKLTEKPRKPTDNPSPVKQVSGEVQQTNREATNKLIKQLHACRMQDIYSLDPVAIASCFPKS